MEEENSTASYDPGLDQTVLLIGHVFNQLAYHRWTKVLSTLIDNKAKVKEIVKVQEPYMDDIGNPYLFGEKLENKLIKVTIEKQKSKALFIEFQSNSLTNH